MTDGVKKGTGNSRYLKTVSNFLTLYPTYEKFAQAFIAGTLPVDLNGINAAGWQTVGTALNKANLLADATATGMGLTAAATPNQAFEKLRTLVTTAQNTAGGKAQIATGSYTGAGGNYTEASPLRMSFPFSPQFVLVYMYQQQRHVGYSQSVGRYVNYHDEFQIWLNNPDGLDLLSCTNGIVNVKFSGKTVSRYVPGNVMAHDALMCTMNKKYGYVAIG